MPMPMHCQAPSEACTTAEGGVLGKNWGKDQKLVEVLLLLKGGKCLKHHAGGVGGSNEVAHL